MKIEQLLADWPPERRVPGARAQIMKKLRDEGGKIVVLDDDPMGTQAIHGVDVFMSRRESWPDSELQEIFRAESAVSFLSINSRSLPESAAIELNGMLAQRLKSCAARAGRKLLIVSRSDSTLRGHFPSDMQAIRRGLGEEIDGTILAPAFFEGGRFTIDDTQWVEQHGNLVPSHQTEFANDPQFKYSSAHLPSWVEEKSEGHISPGDVLTVSLADIRSGGPERVCQLLRRTGNGQTVVVNAACYSDLEVFVLGLIEAEAEGKRFLYRSAAPFVKVRAGIPDRPLLDSVELGARGDPGVVLVGSYTRKSTVQLAQLLKCDRVSGIEVRLDPLFDDRRSAVLINSIAEQADASLAQGITPVIFTERTAIEREGADFLQAGAVIAEALCRILNALQESPAFLVVKGGSTSHRVAGRYLRIHRASVLGQLAEGVPVWRVADGAHRANTLFVLFPGNQGTEDTLAQVYELLVPP